MTKSTMYWYLRREVGRSDFLCCINTVPVPISTFFFNLKFYFIKNKKIHSSFKFVKSLRGYGVPRLSGIGMPYEFSTKEAMMPNYFLKLLGRVR